MTSDERLIETLRNIKDYCKEMPNCSFCLFNGKDTVCELRALITELHKTPSRWDMEKIEKIVKGEQK